MPAAPKPKPLKKGDRRKPQRSKPLGRMRITNQSEIMRAIEYLFKMRGSAASWIESTQSNATAASWICGCHLSTKTGEVTMCDIHRSAFRKTEEQE